MPVLRISDSRAVYAQRPVSDKNPMAGACLACLKNSKEANLTGGVNQRKQNKRKSQRGDDAGIEMLVSRSLSWL